MSTRPTITSLGTGAPNVAGLVYVAAFAADEGESPAALSSGGPPRHRHRPGPSRRD